MKAKIIKYENREATVLFKSNSIEKLFGIKDYKKTFFWNGNQNWLDGSKIWYEKETNKKHGRFKQIDNYIVKSFWE